MTNAIVFSHFSRYVPEEPQVLAKVKDFTDAGTEGGRTGQIYTTCVRIATAYALL
jgi:hypothetical protein